MTPDRQSLRRDYVVIREVLSANCRENSRALDALYRLALALGEVLGPVVDVEGRPLGGPPAEQGRLLDVPPREY